MISRNLMKRQQLEGASVIIWVTVIIIIIARTLDSWTIGHWHSWLCLGSIISTRQSGQLSSSFSRWTRLQHHRTTKQWSLCTPITTLYITALISTALSTHYITALHNMVLKVTMGLINEKRYYHDKEQPLKLDKCDM